MYRESTIFEFKKTRQLSKNKLLSVGRIDVKLQQDTSGWNLSFGIPVVEKKTSLKQTPFLAESMSNFNQPLQDVIPDYDESQKC
jgi:hypothetical protein